MLPILIIMCELPGRISNEFDHIYDQVDQSDWYLFSSEMQQMLIVIMGNAQQEVDFQCFGSLICNRATFKRVRIINDKIWALKLILYVHSTF